MRKFFFLLFGIFLSVNLSAEHSIARQWNEMVLTAIRNDVARPTVHARNLFHTSAAMYDAWAIYDGGADTYFLGKTIDGFSIPFASVATVEDVKAAQEEAMSYAVYRLLMHRFQNSPRFILTEALANQLMEDLGYDTDFIDTNYASSPAALGNYIASQIIQFGFQDGSNEVNDYTNRIYQPVNTPLDITEYSTPIEDLNRWQPLEFPGGFVGQAGFLASDPLPAFLSPEWGQVTPFALREEDSIVYEREEGAYTLYHDPGPPVYAAMDGSGTSDEFRWGHVLVALWSEQLAPSDSVFWDISPASIGNLEDFPTTVEGLRDFYDEFEGGDPSRGHAVNPITGKAYEPQIVPRGDYARVLAEFWADGPDSETPPGHWFTILNYVSDQATLVKKFQGEGQILSDLEWDVKAYFTLGGTMHDVAITAWGLKGWYDYVRPVSAIRGMAKLGQSSDPNLPNYHPMGLPLIENYIELIEEGDPLLTADERTSLHDLKIRAWRGNTTIEFPLYEQAGVGWIAAEAWEPYQRPNFVTPPFAGYVSGHSTFSRAAAEVLTAFTGDAFFPNGMGEFFCQQNEFLVFEEGPSVDLTLQWATYRDAADQCSLSRIWGGIHPPIDDIPGRIIGEQIGKDAFEYAAAYFERDAPLPTITATEVFPNPTTSSVFLNHTDNASLEISVFQTDGQQVLEQQLDFVNGQAILNLGSLLTGVYFIGGWDASGTRVLSSKVVLEN